MTSPMSVMLAPFQLFTVVSCAEEGFRLTVRFAEDHTRKPKLPPGVPGAPPMGGFPGKGHMGGYGHRGMMPPSPVPGDATGMYMYPGHPPSAQYGYHVPGGFMGGPASPAPGHAAAGYPDGREFRDGASNPGGGHGPWSAGPSGGDKASAAGGSAGASQVRASPGGERGFFRRAVQPPCGNRLPLGAPPPRLFFSLFCAFRASTVVVLAEELLCSRVEV